MRKRLGAETAWRQAEDSSGPNWPGTAAPVRTEKSTVGERKNYGVLEMRTEGKRYAGAERIGGREPRGISAERWEGAPILRSMRAEWTLRERGAGAERKGGISNARGGRAKSMPRSVGIRTGAQGGGWPGDQGRARPFPRLRGFPYRATCTGNIRAFPEPAVSMPALRAGRTGARLRF